MWHQLEALLVPRPEDGRHHSSRPRNRALSPKDSSRTGRKHHSGRSRRPHNRGSLPEQPGEVGRTQKSRRTHGLRDLDISSAEQEGKLQTENYGLSRVDDVRDTTVVIPQNEDEAHEQIKAVYDEKITSNQGWMARAFTNILKESARLYSDSTRFLYELIQNADDNHYRNVVPTLDITLKQIGDHRTLRFDCNEIGFSHDNIKAICSLSESSKANTGKARQYIGEKGLGFKSVFAVSDVVHIRSGFYSFKFNNQASEPLGMVTPIWEAFPEDKTTAQTSILLELSAACPMKDLHERLKTMAPTFLLFLRQLAEINIKIVDNGSKRRITLKRQDAGLKDSPHSNSVTVHRNDESTTYTTFHRQVSIEAKDDRRIGCSTTELVLAFPTGSRSNHRNSKDDTQHVYAFLPVYDYKLKFIIHADFILISNRQGLAPSPWNKEILNAIPAAFLNAVNAFISTEENVRYRWLRYVPLPRLVDRVFNNVATETIRLLSQNPVLEDDEGNFTIPSRLTYVSSDYRDADMKPLIPPAREHLRYVSDQYSSEDEDILLKLGIGEITPVHFLTALNEFVSKSEELFQSRPLQWHQRLSMVLVTLINKGTSGSGYKDIISKMSLIPLQNGKWTNAVDGTVIFPMSTDSLIIPEGIPVFEVHRDAATDPSRRNLLSLLGVKQFQTRDICEAIVRSHTDSQFVSNGVPVPDLIAKLPLPQLVSHINFLMTAKWSSRSAGRTDLWFVAEKGSSRRGSTLYVEWGGAYSASRIFRREDSEHSNPTSPEQYSIDFLHRSYAVVLSSSNKNWMHWLCQNLELTTLPRLVTPHVPGRPFTLMEDFKLLVKNEPALTVLMLLREHWVHYKQWITSEQDRKSHYSIDKQSASHIQRYLSHLNVPCTNGAHAPLRQTVLPSRDVLLALGFGVESPPNNQLRPESQIPTSVSDKIIPVPRLSSKQKDTVHLRVNETSGTSSDVYSKSVREVDLTVEKPSSTNQRRSREDHNRDDRKSKDMHWSYDRHKNLDRRTSRERYKENEKYKSSHRHKGRKRHRSKGGHERERHGSRDRSRSRRRSRKSSQSRDRHHNRGRHESGNRDVIRLSLERGPSQHIRESQSNHNTQDNQKGPGNRNHLTSLSDAKADSKLDDEKRTSELFLDVPNPDEDKWNFLQHLGVIVQMSADMFVDRLRQLKDMPTTTKHVDLLYEKIEKSVRELGTGNLVKAFKEEPLIYWPSGSDDGLGKWVTVGKCVWTGPECVKNTPKLSMKYRGRSHLFTTVLHCKNADIFSLVEEAGFITPEDSLERIADLFREIYHESKINNFWKNRTLVNTLISLRIYPTTTALERSGFMQLETATNDSEWYIPDQLQTAKLFEPKLRLLAFHPQTTANLSHLFEALGLQNRVLSKVTTKSTVEEGVTDPNPAYQEWLHTRLGYIKGLLSPEPVRSRILSQLQQMQVYKTERIIITWTVKRLNGSIGAQCTEDGEAFIAAKDSPNRLEMFLLHRDSAPGQVPMVLIMKLSRLCGIIGGEGGIILSHILSQHSTDQIEKYLKRQGIPFDPVIQEDIKVGDIDSGEEVDSALRGATKGGTPEPIQAADSVLQEANKDGIPEPKQAADSVSQEAIRDGTLESNQVVDSLLSPPAPPSWSTSEDVPGAKVAPVLLTVSDADEANRASARKVLDITNRSTKPHAGRPPSPFNQFKNMEASFLRVDPPSTMFVSKNTEQNTVYIGELYVSKFLEDVLKDDYVPDDHWLSPLRTGDGHTMYRRQEEECFPFKFDDKTGRFRQFLLDRGSAVADFSETNIFHIGVWTSVGKIGFSVNLSHAQYKKAKDLTAVGKQSSGPVEHLIIAQIGYLYGDTEMLLYVNPYGMMDFEKQSVFSASFRGDAQAIVVPASSAISNDATNNIYKQHMNGLAQIRLIELFPDEYNKPLKGALHVVPADNPGSFWALSYVWGGAPSKFAPYYFETKEGQILITSSLSLALKQIRKQITEKSIRVWADAVCINQNDSYEKAGQIPLMGEIYKRAKRVFAWLGPEDDKTAEAMEFLSCISSSKCAPDHEDSSLGLSPSLDINSAKESTRTALEHLLSSSWFTRVWIVQELILGSDVYLVYGDAELEWGRFFSAVRVCENQLRKTKTHWSLRRSLFPTLALGIVRDYRHLEDRLFTLLELLELFAYTSATKEEDKLFALLGLALEHANDDFKPEYGPSPEFAIRKYAAAFVKNHEAMQLIYRAGISKSYHFCSWIPLWTRGPPPQTISDWNCASELGHFYAGRRIPSEAKIHNSNPNVLVVHGQLIDTIITQAEIRFGIANYLEWVKTMVDFRRLLQSLGSDYPTTRESHPARETWQQMMFRFPIGNARRPCVEADDHNLIVAQILGSSASETFHPSHCEDQDDIWPEDLPAQLQSFQVDQDAKHYEQKPKETRNWIERYWQTAAVFAKRLDGARFCVTERGYAGLLPRAAKVGDAICVFDGGRVPFVLTKSVTGYGIVGECYVHGFMNGEGRTPDLGSKSRGQDFRVQQFELF